MSENIIESLFLMRSVSKIISAKVFDYEMM